MMANSNQQDQGKKQQNQSDDTDSDTGRKSGDRPAQPGAGDQQIVGQTLEQAKKYGEQGGQIVKEAVAKGLEQMNQSKGSDDDDGGTGSNAGNKSTRGNNR